MTKTTNASPEALAEKCADAFSFDRYANWTACARMLQAHSLTDQQVEAVLRSKWTRWAADASHQKYGRATSKDLERLITKQKWWGREVEKLTRETFTNLSEMSGEFGFTL